MSEERDLEKELKEEKDRYEQQNQEAYDEQTKANEELRRIQEERKRRAEIRTKKKQRINRRKQIEAANKRREEFEQEEREFYRRQDPNAKIFNRDGQEVAEDGSIIVDDSPVTGPVIEPKEGDVDTDTFGNPVYGFKGNLGASIAFEVGANTLLDLFSPVLPLQSGGSYVINLISQIIRDPSKIGSLNQLEAGAAATSSLIPGANQYAAFLKGVKPATRGTQLARQIGRGAVDANINVAGERIGSGQELTGEDIATATAFGGTLGGLIGSAPDIFSGGGDLPKVFRNIRKRLDGGPELVTPEGVNLGQATPEFEPTTAFAMGGPGSGRRKKVDQSALEAAGQTNIFKSFAADPRLGVTDDQMMDVYKTYRIKKGDPYVEPKKAFKRGLVTRKIKVTDLEPILKEHPEIPKDKINEYIEFVNQESKGKGNNLGKTITFLNDAYINGKLGVKKLGNLTVEDLTPNKVRTGDPQEIAEDMSSILGQNITVKTLDNIIQEKVSIPVEISDEVVMQVTDLKSLTKAYMARIQRFTGIPAFERGHVFAAKNIWDDRKVTSLSDYKGNLEPEIARSTYNIVDGQSFDDLLKGVDLEDILKGNRSRAEKSDPDKVVARLLGTDYGLRESFLNFVYPQRALSNKIPADAKASFIDDYVEEMNIALMDYDDGGTVGVHTLDFIRAAVLKKILPKYELLNDELIEGLITTTNKVTGRNMAAEVNEALERNLVNPQEIRRAGDAR